MAATIGRTLADNNGAKASVDWVGDVNGAADDQNFATLGGRVGWRVDEIWKVETSLSATFRQQMQARLITAKVPWKRQLNYTRPLRQ